MNKLNKSLIVNMFFVSLVLVLAGPVTALAAGPAGVNLGSAGNYSILSKTGISVSGPTTITGNIGVSPAGSSSISGLLLSPSSDNTYATSASVSGTVYASNYASPTPANLNSAILDMQSAYTDAVNRTGSAVTNLGSGNIGGMTLAPGLYSFNSNVSIPANLTLSGSASDIWIFQVGQNLELSPSAQIILVGGAQASNVYWQVAGQTTIGSNSIFNGNILDQSAITLNSGSVLNGKAFAQGTVYLNSTAIRQSSNQALIAQIRQQLISLIQQVIPILQARIAAILAGTPQLPDTGFFTVAR